MSMHVYGYIMIINFEGFSNYCRHATVAHIYKRRIPRVVKFQRVNLTKDEVIVRAVRGYHQFSTKNKKLFITTFFVERYWRFILRFVIFCNSNS